MYSNSWSISRVHTTPFRVVHKTNDDHISPVDTGKKINIGAFPVWPKVAVGFDRTAHRTGLFNVMNVYKLKINDNRSLVDGKPLVFLYSAAAPISLATTERAWYHWYTIALSGVHGSPCRVKKVKKIWNISTIKAGTHWRI